MLECFFCPVCLQGFHDWPIDHDPPNPHHEPGNDEMCTGEAVWSVIAPLADFKQAWVAQAESAPEGYGYLFDGKPGGSNLRDPHPVLFIKAPS